MGITLGVYSQAGGSNYLLDQYPGAGFAYGFKRFKGSYSSNNIKARENAGSTEQNIGFTAEVLDISSLLTFTGSNDGLLPIIYDQSTNGNNFTQTIAANQLEIVDAGSLVTSNSLAATQGSSTTGGKTSSIAFSGMTDIWFFDVLDVTNTSTPQVLYESSPNYASSTGAFLITIQSNVLRVSNKNSSNEGRNNYNISTGRQVISIRMRAGVSIATFSEVYINGSQIPISATTGTGNSIFSNQVLYISARGGRFYGFQGKRQASIFYPSDQSSNRTEIETNLNNYYDIY